MSDEFDFDYLFNPQLPSRSNEQPLIKQEQYKQPMSLPLLFQDITPLPQETLMNMASEDDDEDEEVPGERYFCDPQDDLSLLPPVDYPHFDDFSEFNTVPDFEEPKWNPSYVFMDQRDYTNVLINDGESPLTVPKPPPVERNPHFPSNPSQEPEPSSQESVTSPQLTDDTSDLDYSPGEFDDAPEVPILSARGKGPVRKKSKSRKPFRRGSRKDKFICTQLTSTGEQCGKLFGRPYDLERHLDIHNPNRPTHFCKYCPGQEKLFSRADALTRHIKNKHGL